MARGPTDAPRLDWNDIPIVLALGQVRSMSAAARKLGVETSTISRRLAAVEAAVQARLFIRGAGGYRPTDAGLAFLRHAEAAYGEVHSLVAATTEQARAVEGPVRITAIDVLFDQWLVPRIPALLEAHPGLQLQLIPDNQNLSFGRREADIGLRVAQPADDAAVLMRKVGSVGFAVYAAPSLRDVPRQAWPSLPWLAYGEDLAHTPEMAWLRGVGPHAEPRVRSSSVASLLRACEAGLGLVLLPCLVADAARVLRLSAEPELQRDVWLLGHRDAARIRRFRVVSDWLAQCLEEDAVRLSGRRR